MKPKMKFSMEYHILIRKLARLYLRRARAAAKQAQQPTAKAIQSLIKDAKPRCGRDVEKSIQDLIYTDLV